MRAIHKTMSNGQTIIAGKRRCACGCDRMTIGQAWTVNLKRIYPYVCVDCSGVQTQYAKKADALREAKKLGRELPEVMTATQANKDMWDAEMALREGLKCEVCESVEDIQRHHWAPWHLFGKECDRWPTSLLCQKCHTLWHQVVTPNMGKPPTLTV